MSRVEVAEAVRKLKKGEVVALPTETVYGLAGRIDNEGALRAIFALKKRPLFDPLIVHVRDAEQARGFVREWPEIYDVLVAKFWPGPLTLLAPKNEKISALITSGLDTVALRAPAHPLAQQVLEQLEVPLAAPSANLFGKTSPTRAEHVEGEFSGRIPTLDGGPCEVGVESTVLQAHRDGDLWRIQILRPGGVSREDLRQALKGHKFEIERATSKASPGSLKTHYQPRSPLIILNEKKWSDEIQLVVVKYLGRPVLSLSEIRLPSTPQEAARVLYEELRRNSRDDKHVLWIAREPQHQGEAWEAVWDRVQRASSLTI